MGQSASQLHHIAAHAPAIEIRGLSKIYRGKKSEVQALKSIDLVVPRGSFFGLLGPNGAGKSTLISILAGITIKTAGQVSICGYDIEEDARAARHAIGIVPQELLLDPFFPVYEALENHAGYYGIAPKDRRTKEIIEAVGLTDKAFTPARKLSGGMKRRLMVAKAMVHSPEVIILDEPTAGVDVELRRQLWAYIKQLNKNGTTVLLTTHYLEEAQELCDYIAVINKGELIACDKTAILLKMLDKKQVIIITKEPLSEIPASLHAFDISRAEDDPHRITLTYHSSVVSFDQILSAIAAIPGAITDLSTSEPDLEDIFHHLMQTNN